MSRRALRLAVVGIGAAALIGCNGPEEPSRAGGELFPDTLTLSGTPEGRLYESFLRAYDTGDLDSLRAFADERLEPDDANPGRAGSFASYWLATYREFGPVRPFRMDTTVTPPRVWVHGTVTDGWSYFRFLPSDSDPSRIRGYGVARGVRPPEAPTRSPVPADELPARLHDYLSMMAREDFFSGVVLVLRDDETVFHRAYGTADRRHGVPNDTTTRFLIASTAKPFTAVAVLQLLEAGVLDLDDVLAEHIQEYPDRVGSAVTLRHLLTHTSGIELDDHPPFNEEVRRARSTDELLEAQLRYIEHLNRGSVEEFTLPEGFDYTNDGYDLLGEIVQRVSGRTWEDRLRESVFGPAGMERTGFHHDTVVAALATGYSRGDDHPRGRRRENHTAVSPFARPAGGLFSTARDLARFVEALQAGELLSRGLLEEATSPQVPWAEGPGFRASYGFGFEVEEVSGVRYWGHSGSQPGVASRMRVYPALGYATIVLSNYDNAARHVTAHIMSLITGRRE